MLYAVKLERVLHSISGKPFLAGGGMEKILPTAQSKTRADRIRRCALPLFRKPADCPARLLLGHAQAATTHRYAYLDTDPLRRAVDAIGDRLLTAMTPEGG
jgi:hypothetical protein